MGFGHHAGMDSAPQARPALLPASAPTGAAWPAPLPRPAAPRISAVVPAYNEAANLPSLLAALTGVLAALSAHWEVIVVDDGSSDDTALAIAPWLARPGLRCLRLSRNFGKEAALTAGIDAAQGDAVVLIDADMQHPPALIAEMLARWREGADMVCTAKASRADEGLRKRIGTWLFYRLVNADSRAPIPVDAGDFRLMDRRVVDEVNRLRERSRFMKGLMAWPGFRTESVEFERPQRTSGKTSWNYWKLWNFALDGLTSFSTVPLRLWLYIGAMVSLLSFLYAAFIVLRAIVTGVDVPGYPSLMASIMFFGGIQLVSIGLVGEYVGRIFHEIKGRPIYVVDTIE